jgi:hypothetical protein
MRPILKCLYLLQLLNTLPRKREWVYTEKALCYKLSLHACSTVEDIERILRGSYTISMPYVMLQPKMRNNFEYKVICWGMTAISVCISKRGYGRAFANSDEGKAKLLDFANSAVLHLKENCPHAIVDGLIRVDIFQTADDPPRLIVNEYEGMEARYCTSGKNSKIEMEISHNMRAYWFDIIDNCIKNYYDMRRYRRRQPPAIEDA